MAEGEGYRARVLCRAEDWDLALLTVDEDAFWSGVEVHSLILSSPSFLGRAASRGSSPPSFLSPRCLVRRSLPFSGFGPSFPTLPASLRPPDASLPPSSRPSQAAPLNAQVTCRPDSFVTVAGFYNKSLTTDEWMVQDYALGPSCLNLNLCESLSLSLFPCLNPACGVCPGPPRWASARLSAFPLASSSFPPPPRSLFPPL